MTRKAPEPTPPELSTLLLSDLASLLGHRHPPSTPLPYGTAGFRSHASNLPEAMLRCGVLASLRSTALAGRTVGLMITASHNPAADNGVKLVEPDGSMLTVAWEAPAARFVNARTAPLDALADLLHPPDLLAARGSVLLGRDTRASSRPFADLVRQGVEALGGSVRDAGVVTTPQLHYLVRGTDRGESPELADYYKQLVLSFGNLRQKSVHSIRGLVVDCACGVGAQAMEAVSSVVPGLVLVNRPADGELNARCGADFVQKQREMPIVHGEMPQGDIWASLDGDADRLVMFRRERDGAAEGMSLMDGDRFAVLVAWFVSKHLQRACMQHLDIAVAQTAYSNGAATEFLRQLPGVEVVVAKTGVKHLEKAVRLFDIGIYWEPNGHGTVLFSDKAVSLLQEAREKRAPTNNLGEEIESQDVLFAISMLANQAVGDGVADLLLVLGILSREAMGFDDWLGLYDERTSHNLVVRVADKNVICTEDCDRRVREPHALRDAVDRIAAQQGCRAFVRPSGTEDVVRVYAEAPVGQEGLAREMAFDIARSVFDHCGGVGERM